MNRKRIVLVAADRRRDCRRHRVYAAWFRATTGLQGSGTVEARNIRVGSKVGGRIDKVLVREGDHVKAGQVLITFDDKELLASLEQSTSQRGKSQTRLSPGRNRRSSRSGARKPRPITSCGKNGYRKEDIAAAQADLDRAAADEAARISIFSATTRLPKKIWSPSSSATPPKPTGRWRWRSRKISSTNWTS